MEWMESGRAAGVDRMEGIILRDHDGALYEVPSLVIERYRVSADRAVELSGAAAMPDEIETGAWWTVAGAVFRPVQPR